MPERSSVAAARPRAAGWKTVPHRFLREKYLWLLLVPGIAWYLIFCYGPMYGLIIAFKDFSP